MTVRFAWSLSAVALALHAGWEFVQCVPFYVAGRFPMTLAGMLQAVLGDGVLTWLICGAAALLTRRPLAGGGRVNPRELTTLAAIGATVAIAIELHALAAGRWRYSPLMPLIPVIGVGLLPVLQMSVLPVLALWAARRGSRSLSEQ